VGLLFYSYTINEIQMIFINGHTFSPGEYATAMSEVVENLIVKCGKQLPTGLIQGDKIQEWKKYTIQYFKISPNTFLIENEFFQSLTQNMKVQLIKENLSLPYSGSEQLILPSFYKLFDIIFLDYEFGFKADDRLVCQVLASLSYHTYDPNGGIIEQKVISRGIYFIFEG
jgi:hypothetical protein